MPLPTGGVRCMASVQFAIVSRPPPSLSAANFRPLTSRGETQGLLYFHGQFPPHFDHIYDLYFSTPNELYSTTLINVPMSQFPCVACSASCGRHVVHRGRASTVPRMCKIIKVTSYKHVQYICNFCVLLYVKQAWIGHRHLPHSHLHRLWRPLCRLREGTRGQLNHWQALKPLQWARDQTLEFPCAAMRPAAEAVRQQREGSSPTASLKTAGR